MNVRDLIGALEYWAFLALIQRIRIIPYRMAIALGRIAGVLAWACDPLHRKTAAIQMRTALGETYHPGMPLKVSMNHGDILIDAIRYAYMNDIAILRRVTVEGQEHLDIALATGRGVMLITGHIGN